LPVPDEQWRFDPSSGLAGQASIIGSGGSRLEVECGNGGAPAFWIEPDPRSGASKDRERVTFALEVDGQRFGHEMECGGGSYCGSYGFPDRALIDRLRSGGKLTIRNDNKPLTGYSLKGSNAAISRLTECLDY